MADKDYPFPQRDPAATVYYQGLDISTYPGDSVMSTWWQHSPCYFTGFYLAPAPHHTNTTWMGARAHLKSVGWGFLPIYFGRQAGDSNLTSAQGTADANSAASLAAQAGFGLGAYIFLDVETGGTLSSAFISYIKAFLLQLDGHTNYNAGVYCSFYQSADQIKNAIGSLTCRFWCFNVDCPPSPGCVDQENPPANCGVSYAYAWQYAQSPEPTGISCTGYSSGECKRTWGEATSYNVDLNTSGDPNPGNG